MRLPGGLQAKVLAAAMAALLVVLLALLALMWRQSELQRETRVDARRTVHEMLTKRIRSRGEALVLQAADTLVNPLYYFDLDRVGEIARDILRQPDVSYVLVYDRDGAVIHDGSGDIATYGQVMRDPLAFEAVSSQRLHLQSTPDLLDISAPIRVGEQRLGGIRVGLSLKSMMAEEAQASQEMGNRLDRLGRYHLLALGVVMCAMLLMALALGWILHRALVGPIKQLAEATRQIEAGNYDVAVADTRRHDEVGDLVRAFRRMSGSIVRHDRDIRRMAYTDALTSLSNRLAFREHLDARLLELRGSGQELALLFADIDDFKRVNDTLGHDAGDEVLVQFANRIREAVERHGGNSAALARFGGDEFVILLQTGSDPGADVRHAASMLAEHLVEELRRPIHIEGRQVFLGTSIGVTVFPEDASNAAMLMKNGDIAMYQAKVAGKNCYRFYSRAMDQAVERRVRLEQDLRGAWERGELSLVYQPIYRLSDGRLSGSEALLRWNHPEQGNIPPSVFIEVAEQSGLIEQFGPSLLRVACEDMVRWTRDAGADQQLFVSVNLSPRQLRSSQLPDQVAAALADTGLAARRLHLELTETAVIGDELHASGLLSRLRGTGVQVWLDDFGTGFSGLSHLRRVPVDGVKIDRSFVADMLRDPDDLALTTSIISMAHSLGITVVAEGVENEGQHTMLRQRGCDLAQGYWLGQPMSAQEFARLLS